MISTGSFLLIVGLNGLGSGVHLMPAPQTEIDLESINYIAADLTSYELYLKLIPTQMNSAQEGTQVQLEFLSHARGQIESLLRREIENLPAIQKMREMPKGWLKSAGEAIAAEEEVPLRETQSEEAVVTAPAVEVVASEAAETLPPPVEVPATAPEERSVEHQFGVDINPAVTQARVKYSGYLDANVSYIGIIRELELGLSKTFGSTKVSFDHLIQADSKSMLRMSWNW